MSACVFSFPHVCVCVLSISVFFPLHGFPIMYGCHQCVAIVRVHALVFHLHAIHDATSRVQLHTHAFIGIVH